MSLQDKLKGYMQDKLEAQKKAGKEFLEKNKTIPGVKELPGGLQYEIIKEGTGRQPVLSNQIKAHYKGALLDGKEFDSSFKRTQPFAAPLTALIQGWQIAIPMMKEGS